MFPGTFGKELLFRVRRRLRLLGDSRRRLRPHQMFTLTLGLWYGADMLRNFWQGTFVPGAAETPACWVIPRGDSAPAKRSTLCQATGKGRNIPGTCAAELLPSRVGRSLRPYPWRSLRPHHKLPHHQLTDKGRNLPGSCGMELCSVSQGGDSGHLRRRLRPPEVSSRRLKAEVPAG